MKKRIFSAFLAAILIFGMMPVTAVAEEPHTHDGKTFEAWNSTNSLPTTSGSYYLTNDVTFSGSQCVIQKDANIDLCLNGHVITLNGTGGGNNNISINLGATLNLYDCKTAEHKFTVDANGLWTLNESATENYETVTGGCITGGVNGTGGAIYLSWSDTGAIGATLNMYGGNIVGNKATGNGGGAVYVDRPSTFNMYGGKIIGNIATKNGGAVYLHTENKGRNVTFNMSGGEICDNKATEFGGGVYVESNIGTFNMFGGTIAGCSAQKGGGVFTYGSMNMSGDGAIRDCMATIDGGGVCACNCSFSMAGNSVVSNCVADNGGGGVYSWAGTGATANFTMSGASKIENCVAKYTYASNLRSGGGLCVENSTFTMTGGAITNNTSATDGGGVYYMSGNATLGSTAKITDNVKGDTLSGGTANNIYLPNNKTVTLGTDDNSPQTGMSVGVTTQTGPTEGSPVMITTNGASTDTSYFTPDNDAYEVKFNVNYLELAVKAASHVHNLVKVDGQAATEAASGWQDYYECKDIEDACHAYFEDETGNTSIPDLSVWKAEGGNGYIAKLNALKYGITVSNDGNGTSCASVTEAASGTNVTLTATPSSGYTFDSWEVISGGITISGNTFTMPANAVEVKAKFKLATPGPGPKPQGNYLDSLDDMFEAAIATGSTDTIYWDEGDALPNYIMRLLFENPNLSLDFKYTCEGVEHEIYIGPGEATNDDIEWYGPLWLLGKYGEKKDIHAIPIHGVYVIQKGDTLNELAKKLNTTVDALLSLNPYIKNRNLIYPGNTLNY